MASARRGTARSGSRARARPSRARRQLRLVWLLLLVAVACLLYSRPLASFVETRRELERVEAEVAGLEEVRAGLERRLAASMSLEAAEREARRMGWVRPGERLFVVKGIPAWREAQARRRETP
ncbi:MAG: septum formation initiator family protein [Thermoleophilia bacterium]|nr:septum formation initiator family protein [Gaiellaceae bacterium]MDW8339388.1 septum formation initiator family protein [Thermoleophilia bacterium]